MESNNKLIDILLTEYENGVLREGSFEDDLDTISKKQVATMWDNLPDIDAADLLCGTVATVTNVLGIGKGGSINNLPIFGDIMDLFKNTWSQF